MCQKFYFIFLLAFLSQKVTPIDNVTTMPSVRALSDDDDDDWDEDDDDSPEIDDDGRVYKNPRNSPSALCPRDEEQASLLGQKCLRKCSSDEDCKSKKKKCLCDGACGMSCIKPDRECPELSEIELGTVTMTGRLFGDRATYTCQHGFHVVGLQSRTCQADGQWAGTAPACKQNIYCLSPPSVEHARHNALPEQTTFDLDSSLQYYCHTGYVTNGFPRAKCLEMDGQASWYGPDISCEPRSCGPPTDISHGWHAGDCYTYECRVNYHCSEGFELVGRSERFCQADGTWAPKELPTCVPVQCPPPDNPRHGKAIYTSCSYNSVVSYECKYGYTLVGETTRRCGADRQWSGSMPQCKEINCGHPGRLWNGWLENIEAGTGLGASIIFRCHEGMKLEGHTSTVCQIDGKWRYPLPNCSAPCVVPQVSMGHVYVLPKPNATADGAASGSGAGISVTTDVSNAVVHQPAVVQHGEKLAVVCQPQYEFLFTQTPVTCNNGTWTHIPKCEPARCKYIPKPPRNGMIIAPKTDHGMKAIFKCKDGYVLRGKPYVECSYGNWTGEHPSCEEVYCPFPGYIENGKVLLVGNMGLYDYRPYVRKITNNKQIQYECDKGYVLADGPPGATCIGGRWSPKQLPRCILGQHPRFRWNRKRRSILLRQRIKRSLFFQRFFNNIVSEQPMMRRSADSEMSTLYRNKHSLLYQRSKQMLLNYLKNDTPRRKRQTEDVHRNSIDTQIKSNGFVTHFSKNYEQEQINQKHEHDAIIAFLTGKKPPNAERIFLDNPSEKMQIFKRHKRSTENRQRKERIVEPQSRGYYPENDDFSNQISELIVDEGQPIIKTLKSNKIKRSLEQKQFTDYFLLMTNEVESRKKRALMSKNVPKPNGSGNQNQLNTRRDGGNKKNIKKQQNLINLNAKPNKKHRPKSPCDPISNEPFVNIEIVKYGRDPNVSYSSGAAVRVACGKGYGSNLNYNATAKCVRGVWKPAKPECKIRNKEIGNLDEHLILSNQTKTVKTKHRKRSLKTKGFAKPKIHNVGRGTMDVRRRGNKHDDDDELFLPEVKSEKKQRPKGPCEPISTEDYVNVEIIKFGKDPNVSHSQGTVVKIACGKGYDINLNTNETAKCVRGVWKPMKPECIILPCHVPETSNGFYRLSPVLEAAPTATNGPPSPSPTVISDDNGILNETMDIENGRVVKFSCNPGYKVKGPSNLKCWHGEWAVTMMPDCTPAPCELPVIPNGQYLSGYRAGLTIGNGSFVTYQCDNFYRKTTVQPIQCLLGELHPRTPSCKRTGPNMFIGLANKTSKASDELEFRAGSDISHNGGLDIIESINSEPCGRPVRVQGTVIYRDGQEISDDNEDTYPEGTEITFDCIASIMGEKTTWRIICEDGSWIGRSLSCDHEEQVINPTYANNVSCVFRNNEPNVMSFYNDQPIREDVVEFPPGAVLVSRCVDIGKYYMVGSSRRRCIGVEWEGHKPACFGLNQENDYAMEKPPTILFRHQLGPIAQSNDGKLIVYPGTIVHMECLWIRRFGQPKWNVSHNYRKYPEGWSTDPGRDSQLEYRITIFHASKDDSGTFTCMTPARQQHSIEIEVKAVHCKEIPPRRGLTVNNKSTKMNTKLHLSCANGNSLIGAHEMTCLPSGNWSHPFPVCESIECGDVFPYANLTYTEEISPHLRVIILSREVGGRAVFSCTPGFGLRGPSETVCLSSGEWALPFPTCVEVQCDPPPLPENGYVQGAGPYKAGDIVQFNCNPDFMMEGQPIIACQDNSRWSGTIPKCIQACSYPGTTISGRMSSVKFYYKIGETITFSCDEGHELKGAPMLRCLKNGKWSNAIPTCVASEITIDSKR